MSNTTQTFDTTKSALLGYDYQGASDRLKLLVFSAFESIRLYMPDTFQSDWGLYLIFGLYLWDWIDGWLSLRYARRYLPFPVPPREEAKYAPSDVSIVVPTVDWDDNLVDNLRTWLICQPREIIFVTTNAQQPKLLHLFNTAPGLREELYRGRVHFHIRTVQQANKRLQLCAGINEAKGKIVALVDDDARWTSEEVLTTLLAPFQNDDVGLVGGSIESYIPEERQRSDVITGWEVAALRTRSKRRAGNRAFFEADGSTNFTVSGLTMLLRAEIVKDPYFQHHFINDMWNGIRQNTGDDGFITRYVLFQHHLRHVGDAGPLRRTPWKLGMQFGPGGTVQTSLLTTGEYAQQSRRWYRSGLRLRLTLLLWEPGLFKFFRTTPYMARKMTGGMLSPIFNLVRLGLWLWLWWHDPTMAELLFLYILSNYVSSLRAFCREFPYVGIKNIWAVILADHAYLISDIFSWCSLSLESWSNRSSVDVGEEEGNVDEVAVSQAPPPRNPQASQPQAPQTFTGPAGKSIYEVSAEEFYAPLPNRPASQAPQEFYGFPASPSQPATKNVAFPKEPMPDFTTGFLPMEETWMEDQNDKNFWAPFQPQQK
ncbi:hypothetical protein GGR53DRAFT_362809 [Hypoxylon sp. FL1150]|nr:hypothetical protein GGR53DRAFT_362809 [Hypoxylon sp. FL1150]